MTDELVNEITKYLDEHICPEDKFKDFCVYIWSEKNSDGEVVPKEYESLKAGYSFWSIRYPGYTCGALIFNSKTKEFDELILTRRGGGFSNHPTIFIDPDKLEKEVTEKFKGCKITYEKLRILVHIKELSRQIKSVTIKDKIKFWFATKYKYTSDKENYFKIVDAVTEQAISDCEKVANEMVEAIFQNIFHSNSGFELTEKIPVLYPEDHKTSSIVDEVKFKTSMQVNITDSVKESICKLDKEFDELKSKSFAALQSLLESNVILKDFYREENNVFVDAFTIVSNYFIDKIENNLRDKVAKEFACSYPITICIDKFDEIKNCVACLRFLTLDNEETYIRKIVIDKEIIIPDVKKICIDFIVKADLF